MLINTISGFLPSVGASVDILRTVMYAKPVNCCRFHPSAALCAFTPCWVTETDQSNGRQNESRHGSAPPPDLTKTQLNCIKSLYWCLWEGCPITFIWIYVLETGKRKQICTVWLFGRDAEWVGASICLCKFVLEKKTWLLCLFVGCALINIVYMFLNLYTLDWTKQQCS